MYDFKETSLLLLSRKYSTNAWTIKFIIVHVGANSAVLFAKYCDFVVHTEKGLHIERIEADHQFMEVNLDKANLFFK